MHIFKLFNKNYESFSDTVRKIEKNLAATSRNLHISQPDAGYDRLAEVYENPRSSLSDKRKAQEYVTVRRKEREARMKAQQAAERAELSESESSRLP